MILLNKLFGIVSGLFFSFICPPLLHSVSLFFLHFERKLVYYVVLPCCTPASSGYNRWSGLRIFSRDWNKNPIDMTVTWLFLFFLSFFFVLFGWNFFSFFAKSQHHVFIVKHRTFLSSYVSLWRKRAWIWFGERVRSFGHQVSNGIACLLFFYIHKFSFMQFKAQSIHHVSVTG